MARRKRRNRLADRGELCQFASPHILETNSWLGRNRHLRRRLACLNGSQGSVSKSWLPSRWFDGRGAVFVNIPTHAVCPALGRLLSVVCKRPAAAPAVFATYWSAHPINDVVSSVPRNLGLNICPVARSRVDTLPVQLFFRHLRSSLFCIKERIDAVDGFDANKSELSARAGSNAARCQSRT